MKTIKIEIPNGFEVDSFDKTSGEIKFKPTPKPIKERIKTFEDVLRELGIIARDFYQQSDKLAPDEVAYRKVKLIAAALNEGWKPDWSNSNEVKYIPWFNMPGSSGSGFSFGDYDYWSTGSAVGSRLCFKSRELAEYAGNQFENIYNEFFNA